MVRNLKETEDLSIDELARLQEREGPARKRRRLSIEAFAEEDLDWVQDENEDTDEEDTGSSDEEGDSSDRDDVGSQEESMSEPNASTSRNAVPPARQPQLVVEDRFGFLNRQKRELVPNPIKIHGNSDSTTITRTSLPSISSFASLGISRPLQAALSSMSIKRPTEVQAACIPPLLANRDCIGNAKTGSGKTIAFALPILEKLSLDPYGIFALVLTPTRELAFQIAEQFAVLGGSVNVKTAVVVGGMDMMTQAIELKNKPHVVIATPGRIVDHLRSSPGEWDLSRVKFLVLDEADRLLTDTFTEELDYLFKALPRERQTCLFTATLTPTIEALADAPPQPGKQKPFVHRMKETVETVATLKQSYILVPSHVREVYLFYLLCNPPESTLHLRRAPPEPTKHGKPKKPSVKGGRRKKEAEESDAIEQPPPTIIFCAKPKTAAYLTLLLKSLGIRSTALHSRLTQRERLSSLGLFRASVIPVLVSTDVGARGLDIEDVAIVVNWDLPNEPEEYTHRVGRTARAGRGGVAISMVTEHDEERVLKIETRIKTKLQEMELPESEVLKHLNAVSTARRLANMELHDSNFGKREEIHKVKNAKRVQPEGEKRVV